MALLPGVDMETMLHLVPVLVPHPAAALVALAMEMAIQDTVTAGQDMEVDLEEDLEVDLEEATSNNTINFSTIDMAAMDLHLAMVTHMVILVEPSHMFNLCC